MSKPISFEKPEVNIVSTMEKTHGVPEPEPPFRIGIFGDFSERTNWGFSNFSNLMIFINLLTSTQKTWIIILS